MIFLKAPHRSVIIKSWTFQGFFQEKVIAKYYDELLNILATPFGTLRTEAIEGNEDIDAGKKWWGKSCYNICHQT